MDLEIDGAGLGAEAGEGADELAVEHVFGEVAEGGEGGAGGGGIGGVGLDEEGGAFAAEQQAGEIRGDGEDELHVAELGQAVGIGFGGGLGHEVEIAGRTQGGDERAGEGAVVGDAEGGGQVFRSELIAKPKSMSCISGMPTIMPNVRRSRFIWMNSLSTMAQRRWKGKRRGLTRNGPSPHPSD